METETVKNKGGRPRGSKTKRAEYYATPAHQRRCKICHHASKDEIEEMYKKWVPWKVIFKLFPDINATNLQHHADGTGLRKIRDRREFYNSILENYNPEKVTAENAIEAAKQLDRIEHVVQESTAPSQIVVNYSWGKALEQKKVLDESTAAGVGSRDRVHTVTDAGEVPPKQEAV